MPPSPPRDGLRGSHASGEPTADSQDDPRLIRALEEYVLAMERGRSFDRERFLAEHADLAPRLASCLEGFEAIQAVRPEYRRSDVDAPSVTRDVVNGPSNDAAPPQALGEFEIRREIGRGGMGIVYEARQESLNRTVALKVLPYAATLDPRQLQRFRTEAQAAASLQHPHIVPVYAVGTDRGVHYFAMQYIDGLTVADLIRVWRINRKEADREAFRAMFGPEIGASPDGGADRSKAEAPLGMAGACRPDSVDTHEFITWIAQLGIQAADALEHAHDVGILHRDVKPGNLLVDRRGHLWITDFGLARIESHASVTRSGDILGTLRYMSPEQALGHRAGIDHRSDVYSLGATLYEALTREPLYQTFDNQELIRRIASESPRPPRRLNHKIPRDLETIVLKALAKEPADRYATAGDLADDLRRFTQDRPIRARRPTASERLHRWARRHRPLVQAAAVAMLLAIGLLSSSTLLLYRQGAESRAQAQRAVMMQRQLLTMAYEMHRYGERMVALEPEKSALQHRMLTKSLGVFERFARDHASDRALDRDSALALRLAGDIHLRLGHHSEAEARYLLATDHLNRLGTPPPPTSNESVNELAHIYNRLGRVNHLKMRWREAIAYYEKSVEEQRGWVPRARWPGPRLDFASYCLDLGQYASQTGHLPRAEAAFAQALAVLQPLSVESDAAGNTRGVSRTEIEALTQSILSRQLRANQDYAQAEKAHRSAVEMYRRLVGMHPERPEFHLRLVESSLHLALLLATCADSEIRDPDESNALVESAMRLDPENADIRILSAQILEILGRHDRAEAVLAEVVARFPDRADAHNNLAWMLITCSGHRRHDASRAIALAERAVHLAPDLGIYWNTLGAAHLRAGDDQAATTALEKSMALRGGGDSFDWFFLAIARHRLGDYGAARHYYASAVDWMDAHASMNKELKQFRDEADALLDVTVIRDPRPGRTKA